MSIMIAIALAAQAAPDLQAQTAAAIPGLRAEEITRCEPRNVNQAVSCISAALGRDATADIAGPAGRAYRSTFEQWITNVWQLDQAGTPVAQDLAKRGVYDPRTAGTVLIAVLDAQRIGERFDYAGLSRHMARNKTAAPAAPAAAAVTPGALPLDRCKRPTDRPDAVITACVQNADGTISRTMSTPASVAPAAAPGALPEGIPSGSVPVPLTDCAAGKPLPPDVVLKACYRLPSGQIARIAAPKK